MSKILMTGANGAFGSLAARTALRRGHELVATMRDPKGRNSTAANDLRELGATVIEIDVTEDGSVRRGVDAALDALGGLDVLANVAGMGTYGLSEGFTSDQLTRLFDLNVVGVHRMMRAALPTLRTQRSGLVINVSSLLGRLSLPFYGPYSAAKFAVESLSDTFRVELSQFGVDVVLVEPGGFKTTWIEALVYPEDKVRLEGYGAFADVPGQTFEQVEAMLAAKPEQDPSRVSDALIDLVEAPAGTRPQRTVVDFVGMAEPVVDMNHLLHETTTNVYRAFGSDGLLKLQVHE